MNNKEELKNIESNGLSRRLMRQNSYFVKRKFWVLSIDFITLAFTRYPHF